MSLLVFDIGGTAVKYAVWDKHELNHKGKFITPKTWEEMKESLINIKVDMEKRFILEGVAFSSPGSVNQVDKQIEGISAVPYIHFFPIYDELESLFELPVTFENDANCAALAEVWKGAAQDKDDVVFVVIGTGIGGAVIVDGKVHHGKHLFGGEFGYQIAAKGRTYSDLATVVRAADRYAQRVGLTLDDIDGEELFRRAEEDEDSIAMEEVETFYYYLAMLIYNVSYAFDPELVLIGGGISNKDNILSKLYEQFGRFEKEILSTTFIPNVKQCQFKNDSNLIGAVYNHIQKQGELKYED